MRSSVLRKRVPSTRPPQAKGIVIRGFRRPRLSVALTATSDQIVAGLNANAAILAFVNAMTLTDLPTLQTPPSWWTTFTTNWTAAQTTVLEWVQTIGPDFSAIPQSISNYNVLFQANVQTIQNACTALEQNPNDSSAVTSLTTALNALVAAAQSEQSLAAQFVTEIDAFAGQLATSAANMNAALQESLQSEGAKRQQIEVLQLQIQNLQMLIGANDELLTTQVLGTAVSLFLMCSGISVVFGDGGTFLLPAGVFGFSPSVITSVNGNLMIQQLQQMIFERSAEMSALNQQIATLNVLDLTVNDLISLTNAAQRSVAAMTEVWSVVQSDISTVLSDLQAAQQQTSSANWPQLAADVSEAQTDWNALQGLVGDLGDVSFNASSTVNPIPMF